MPALRRMVPTHPTPELMIPLLAVLAACAPEVEVEPPSVTFLSPSEAEQVDAGELAVSLIVENFTLADPKHGTDEDGAATGYVAVELDGDGPQNFGSTTFTIPVDAPGEHTLSAELLYADGDTLDEPATASVTFTALDP